MANDTFSRSWIAGSSVKGLFRTPGRLRPSGGYAEFPTLLESSGPPTSLTTEELARGILKAIESVLPPDEEQRSAVYTLLVAELQARSGSVVQQDVADPEEWLTSDPRESPEAAAAFLKMARSFPHPSQVQSDDYTDEELASF